MKADKWLEVNLVGLVILGGLMFLTTKVMNVSAALGQLQASLAVTSDRVDHLAQILPGIATRVAQEEIGRPLRTVVLISNPVHVGSKYQVNISVIDTQGGQKWMAPVTLASAQDGALLAQLAWTGYELDDEFASFSRMADYARTGSFDTALPAGINAAVSFVLGSTSAADYLAAVDRLGFTPQVSPFALRISSWKDLTEALKIHEQAFLTVAPSQAPRVRPTTPGHVSTRRPHRT